MNSVHFSSASDEWATPQGLFCELDEEFHFTLDVCATDDNAKCDLYLTKESDSLKASWLHASDDQGAAWMNPPYGRGIWKWIAKAADTAKQGRRVVALVPARTDTLWWHEYIWDHERHTPRDGVQVRLLKGRLHFGDSENSAPFPSAVVVFG